MCTKNNWQTKEDIQMKNTVFRKHNTTSRRLLFLPNNSNSTEIFRMKNETRENRLA